MKKLLFSLVLFLLCVTIAEAQTYANAPGPENVLVVYKLPDPNNPADTISRAIMDYYTTARNIPAVNVVGLELKDTAITINGITHTVGLAQGTDIIRDFYQHSFGAVTPTFHAWRYYLDFVAIPIKNWITSHNLTSTIRYIVLCKGVPFKIQAAGDYMSRPGNLTVDGLLCMLNTPNYESFIENTIYPFNIKTNPYHNVDPNFTMEYRFLPDHFTGSDYNLSYLVSHLDGVDYETVKGIIDRSVSPDTSGEGWWILDGDPQSLSFSDVRQNLLVIGEKVEWNNDDNWITTFPGKVIGYVSNGAHAEDNNPNWHDSTFWVDLLEFEYANGAIATTIESFNGNSISTLVHRSNHSLVTQFTQKNLNLSSGTGFTANAWEPGLGGITNPAKYFPYYAMGYNQIDAAYLATPNLAWQNVFVGDPLIRIYNYETITVTSDTTITGGDFVGRIIVPEGKTLTIAGGSNLNFKRNSSLMVYGDLIIESQSVLNFNAYSNLRILENGNLSLLPSVIINFNDNSRFETFNNFIISAGDNFNFYNNSSFISKGSLTLSAGAVLNFNGSSKFKVLGKLFSKGSVNNRVYLNSGLSTKLDFDSGDSLDIKHTIFNNFCLHISSNYKRINYILIKDSKFNIYNQSNDLKEIINFGISENYNDIDAMIINTEINGFSSIAIIANTLRNLSIDGCSFITNYSDAIAMNSKGIGDLVVLNSYFRVPKVYHNIRRIDDNLSFINESIKFNNCTFVYPDILEQNSTAIAIENNSNRFSSLKIENCSFTGYNECVYLLNLNNLNPLIRNNSFFDFKSFGINAANGNGIRIINNQFNSSSQISSLQKTGIFLSQISYPHIISNNLSLQQQNIPGAGISLISCNGEIRGNSISGFKYGIELGSSSPNIGANVLTSNTENGIYVGAYSNPNLSYTIINDDVYPVSGYNTIRENGLCNFFPSYSEIYLSNSNIQLKGGCNTIADDREDPALHCNYLYLIDGDHIEETIYAAENYWGEINNHNPEGRFGENITVEYEGYLNEPCNYSSGSEFLLLTDQNGEVFDTVYSSMNNISQLSDIETRYAMANSYFYAKSFTQAKNKYENIIELYGTLRNSLKAYLRLYEIATITNSESDEFNQLHQFYLLKASIQTDSVMIGVLKHLSSLCFVWSKNYEEALARFESDIQNASNNDIALYRMIDILTTSLLIEPDTLVGKRAAGYLTTSTNSSYSEIISELLSTRGKSAANERIKIIPKQFSLYQNFPNPFNPGTTISFDLPKSTQVTLTIYDILGRKIKTVVDERKEAGSYSINVDLGNLSSGVYFYHLQTDDFNATRKMVLLR